MFDFKQAVVDKDGDLSEDRVFGYIDSLMEEFAASQEGQFIIEKYGCVYWAAVMTEYAFNYLGVSPAEMSVSDFDEVVFELFPRKVSVKPEKAACIVAELRAFWTFVAREYGAKNAEKILTSLDNTATSALQTALADPSNYGMAKSFVMAGINSGFDMTTEEGMAAFQAVYNAQLQSGRMGPLPLPMSAGPLPAADLQFELIGPVTHDEVKKKRKDKKRQRQNKKRNRPR